MATKKSGGGVGGFVFNVFNIGFTVFMFILPTIGLIYWYLYIRDPGGGAAPQRQVIVRQVPATPKQGAGHEPRQAAPPQPQAPLTSGFFSESPGSAAAQAERAEPAETKPAAPARKEYETRSWADQSGQFTVQAKFYSVIGDQVKLIAEGQREIVVPIAKLSDADKEYLRSIFREKGIRPSF